MKSKVLKMFDYNQIAIPEEYRQWRVSDEEVRAQLELLGRNHAALVRQETAGPFDAVRCLVSGAGYGTDTVTYVYPKRGLHPVFEEACLGIRAGETREVSLDGDRACLTATDIIRAVPAEINDALICMEGIDGVSTVEAYKAWWKKAEEAKRRYEQGTRGAYYVLEELHKRSEVFIDEEESEAALMERAEMLSHMYDDLPEEMRMTVAQAAEELRPNWRDHFFVPKFFNTYLVDCLRTEPMEDVLLMAKTIFIEKQRFDPKQVEQMIQVNPDGAREQFTEIAAIELLRIGYVDGRMEG